MKKMRKLIPAFAMLMIAAVMMSTASFAWFTMNDNVTATGMQVQAKAAGNLLISTSPLYAASQDISVELNTTKKNLTPITYTTTNSAWEIPANGNKIDPTYGILDGTTLTSVVASDIAFNNSTYFADYVVYLATAGDAASNKTLTATITGIAGADQKVAAAYTIAFYVIAPTVTGTTVTWADPDFNNPSAIISYKDGSKAFDATINLPSTYGVTPDLATGVKVVMRVYVDGNLKEKDVTLEIPTIKPCTGTYNKTQMSGYTFYSDANGVNQLTDVNMWTDGKDLTGIFYYDGDHTTKTVEQKYVNNAQIPTASTTFEVEFKVN